MSNLTSLVLGSLRGGDLDDRLTDHLRAGMVGVSLFREHGNVVSREQVVKLCEDVHEAVGHLPALIAVDQEGGQLQILTGIVTDFPGNMALAATRDVDLAERVGHAMGLELRALGITVNYAPVCDVLTNPTNHGLSIRSFGSDPQSVAAYAAAMVAGLQRAGVAATAKHFPGKGAATKDTHYDTAVIDRSRQEFDSVELVPFVAAFSAGARLAMTSHAIAPALSPNDPRPATLSPEILTDLLRNELGFTGVTITDALDMAAVGEGDSATAAESLDAVRAGADLLLSTPRLDIAEFIAGLTASFEARPLNAQGLDDSARRVVELRTWLSEFAAPSLDVVGSPAHRELADEVAERSITEVVPSAQPGPLDSDCVVIQTKATNLTPADTTSDATASLAGQLSNLGLSPIACEIEHGPTPDDMAAAVEAASARDAVIVITAAATEPGQVELARRVAECARRTTVIVARNPLDLDHLDGIGDSGIICSYGLTESSVRALASVLTGKSEPKGHLPVSRA